MSSRSMATRPVRRPTAMSMVLDAAVGEVVAAAAEEELRRRRRAGSRWRSGLEQVAGAGPPAAEVRPRRAAPRRTRSAGCERAVWCDGGADT